MSLAFIELADRNRRVVQRPLAASSQRQGKVRPYGFAVLALVLAFLLIQGVATAQVHAVRRVLILNEANSSYPGISITINQRILTTLSNSSSHFEIYSDYLDNTLFPDPVVQKEFRGFLHSEISEPPAGRDYHGRGQRRSNSACERRTRMLFPASPLWVVFLCAQWKLFRTPPYQATTLLESEVIWPRTRLYG